MKIIKVINKKSGLVIGHKIEVADTTSLLFQGLLGKNSLGEGEGILPVRCTSIQIKCCLEFLMS